MKNLCWTVRQIQDKIWDEGGIYNAVDWGIHQVMVESDEMRYLLDIAKNAANTLDIVSDRIQEIAEMEDFEE